MTPDLKELATAWRDYKLNNVSNTAEHIGMLFVRKRNFERAATPEAILSLIAELEQFKNNLRTATNVLQSVLNGKTSPMLAQEVVNALNEFQDAAIAKEQS